MDKFDKETRSRIMRSVRSKGNKTTELALIELFKKYGIKGWRRNAKIFGNPDFYFPKIKVVVFADGCFWHGCECRKNKPQTNVSFWENKIKRNKERDKIVTQKLIEKGYIVFRIKECRIKEGKLPKKLKKITERNYEFNLFEF